MAASAEGGDEATIRDEKECRAKEQEKVEIEDEVGHTNVQPRRYLRFISGTEASS